MFGCTDDDFVAAGIEFNDVEGERVRNADAFTLPDCVFPEAGMGAEDATCRIDDVAGSVGFADEFGLIAAIEILAVALLCGGEIVFERNFSYLSFRQVADREAMATELFLREAVEEVGLIFVCIDGAEQLTASVGAAGAGVMAGGESIIGNAGFTCEVREYPKFEHRIASHARVRGSAFKVF